MRKVGGNGGGLVVVVLMFIVAPTLVEAIPQCGGDIYTPSGNFSDCFFPNCDLNRTITSDMTNVVIGAGCANLTLDNVLFEDVVLSDVTFTASQSIWMQETTFEVANSATLYFEVDLEDFAVVVGEIITLSSVDFQGAAFSEDLFVRVGVSSNTSATVVDAKAAIYIDSVNITGFNSVDFDIISDAKIGVTDGSGIGSRFDVALLDSLMVVAPGWFRSEIILRGSIKEESNTPILSGIQFVAQHTRADQIYISVNMNTTIGELFPLPNFFGVSLPSSAMELESVSGTEVDITISSTCFGNGATFLCEEDCITFNSPAAANIVFAVETDATFEITTSGTEIIHFEGQPKTVNGAKIGDFRVLLGGRVKYISTGTACGIRFPGSTYGNIGTLRLASDVIQMKDGNGAVVCVGETSPPPPPPASHQLIEVLEIDIHNQDIWECTTEGNGLVYYADFNISQSFSAVVSGSEYVPSGEGGTLGMRFENPQTTSGFPSVTWIEVSDLLVNGGFGVQFRGNFTHPTPFGDNFTIFVDEQVTVENAADTGAGILFDVGFSSDDDTDESSFTLISHATVTTGIAEIVFMFENLAPGSHRKLKDCVVQAMGNTDKNEIVLEGDFSNQDWSNCDFIAAGVVSGSSVGAGIVTKSVATFAGSTWNQVTFEVNGLISGSSEAFGILMDSNTTNLEMYDSKFSVEGDIMSADDAWGISFVDFTPSIAYNSEFNVAGVILSGTAQGLHYVITSGSDDVPLFDSCRFLVAGSLEGAENGITFSALSTHKTIRFSEVDLAVEAVYPNSFATNPSRGIFFSSIDFELQDGNFDVALYLWEENLSAQHYRGILIEDCTGNIEALIAIADGGTFANSEVIMIQFENFVGVITSSTFTARHLTAGANDAVGIDLFNFEASLDDCFFIVEDLMGSGADSAGIVIESTSLVNKTWDSAFFHVKESVFNQEAIKNSADVIGCNWNQVAFLVEDVHVVSDLFLGVPVISMKPPNIVNTSMTDVSLTARVVTMIASPQSSGESQSMIDLRWVSEYSVFERVSITVETSSMTLDPLWNSSFSQVAGVAFEGAFSGDFITVNAMNLSVSDLQMFDVHTVYGVDFEFDFIESDVFFLGVSSDIITSNVTEVIAGKAELRAYNSNFFDCTYSCSSTLSSVGKSIGILVNAQMEDSSINGLEFRLENYAIASDGPAIGIELENFEFLDCTVLNPEIIIHEGSISSSSL